MLDRPADILFVHPSAELYGSDLQLIETIKATNRNESVVLVLPQDGPLAHRIKDETDLTVDIQFVPTAVLRRSILAPKKIVKFLVESILAVRLARRTIVRNKAKLVFVNTLTIPGWIIAAKLARVRVVCHVHEAEENGSKLALRVLTMPLFAADRVVVNSESARSALKYANPALLKKTTRIYNGVPLPKTPSNRPRSVPAAAAENLRADIVYIGRLSPRKGPDLLLEAAAEVIKLGYDLRITMAGGAFAGYEWYRDDLVTRAQAADLAGRVKFLGYVDSPSHLYQNAHLAVVPSRLEPFGNTAVEAQMAGIPLIAAATQGLTEVVRADRDGLLFENGNSADLALCIVNCIVNPQLALERAERAQTRAMQIFSVERYAKDMRDLIDEVAK